MRHLVHIVGTRPNLVKLAALWRALEGHARQTIVHTGQHYHLGLSGDFARGLELPEPAYNLGVGSGSHSQHSARILQALEPLLHTLRPDLAVVYGDSNSTLAGALVCAYLQLPCAHVEAGLRSRDPGMPEEVNRLVVDRISQVHFAPTREACGNLLAEGIDASQVHFVGNVMIDTLVRLMPRARGLDLSAYPAEFALVTLHRPSNVDDPERLGHLMQELARLSRELPIVFPVHPRTRARLDSLRAVAASPALHLSEPVGYLEFLALQSRARVVITDSGGIQEETTYLNVPCLTLRPNTERPITVELGTNRILPQTRPDLAAAFHDALQAPSGKRPELWDGSAAKRIASILVERSAFIFKP